MTWCFGWNSLRFLSAGYSNPLTGSELIQYFRGAAPTQPKAILDRWQPNSERAFTKKGEKNEPAKMASIEDSVSDDDPFHDDGQHDANTFSRSRPGTVCTCRRDVRGPPAD